MWIRVDSNDVMCTIALQKLLLLSTTTTKVVVVVVVVVVNNNDKRGCPCRVIPGGRERPDGPTLVSWRRGLTVYVGTRNGSETFSDDIEMRSEILSSKTEM